MLAYNHVRNGYGRAYKNLNCCTRTIYPSYKNAFPVPNPESDVFRTHDKSDAEPPEETIGKRASRHRNRVTRPHFDNFDVLAHEESPQGDFVHYVAREFIRWARCGCTSTA